MGVFDSGESGVYSAGAKRHGRAVADFFPDSRGERGERGGVGTTESNRCSFDIFKKKLIT